VSDKAANAGDASLARSFAKGVSLGEVVLNSKERGCEATGAVS